MKTKEIAENIYYVGVNDRHTHLFENMLPLPYGVAYNSYLIADEHTALVDTVGSEFSELFLDKVRTVLQGRKLDYIIINHMEPDHSGSISLIRKYYPEAEIVGNAKTFGMLKGFYGIEEGLHEVKDGDTLPLGKHVLYFVTTPMVHWPETMMTYDKNTQTLFSGDAFGCFGTLDGGVVDTELDAALYWSEMRRYYACIVGKYGSPVQKALQKLSSLPVNMICSTHGPIWKEQVAKVVAMYDAMSQYKAEDGVVIAYGSMYGHTEQMAEQIASALNEQGVRNIFIYDLSKTDMSFVLSDLFKYKGLIIGSPTYCNELYPEVATLLMKIETRAVKDRVFGCFGSFSWAGVAVKRLTEFGEKMKWTDCATSVEAKQALKPFQDADIDAFAKEFAGLMKK